MSVQKGYYHVTTTKLGRDVSAKPTNYHAPVTAVFTRNALTSSVPRAVGTKTVQPKIMSPTTNHSAPKKKIRDFFVYYSQREDSQDCGFAEY